TAATMLVTRSNAPQYNRAARRSACGSGPRGKNDDRDDMAQGDRARDCTGNTSVSSDAGASGAPSLVAGWGLCHLLPARRHRPFETGPAPDELRRLYDPTRAQRQGTPELTCHR